MMETTDSKQLDPAKGPAPEPISEPQASLYEELRSANEALQTEVDALRTALADLQATEETWRLLVRNVTDESIYLLDPEGRIAYWNLGAELLKGFTAGEVLGRDHAMLFPREDQDAGVPAALLAEARRLGSVTTEGWRQRKDGSLFFASVTTTALYASDGALRGFSKLMHDDTDYLETREALKESEVRFRSFVELAADGIVVADEDGQIKLANRAAARIFGYGKGELTHLSIEDLLPGALRSRHSGLRKGYMTSPHPRAMGEGLDLKARRKDGGEFPAEVSLTPLRSSGGLLIAAAVTDITERKQVEQALQDHAEELARSNRELEQFAYVASHDLQEPLRMVSNYTQLLARRYEGRLDADADDFIRFAVDGATRMQQLISDLLDYARVATKGKALAPVEMDRVLDTALLNLEGAIRESSALVQRDRLPLVRGDRGQLVRLLQNLIGNAIKFRGEERPLIRVSAEMRGDDLMISVRDNGIGIDERYGERIFAIFQRLHARDKYTGTGIGLAVCRRIVERHGGRIWLESTPGAGSTFRFTLRKAETHAAAANPPARRAA